jgi:hypothetical protein
MFRRALRGLRRLVSYAPRRDGRPDPGEVVWAWVPYEDRPGEGKDRPVLVIGRDGRTLLGLYLSSNSRRDGEPGWLPLGAGGWDRDGRPSWVRTDRLLRLRAGEVRREGAALDRRRFDRVLAALDAR